MSKAQASRQVVWQRSLEIQTIESCTLTTSPESNTLEGLVLGATGGLPLKIEYRIDCDRGWYTRTVDVRQHHGGAETSLALRRNPQGDWTRDGRPASALAGCTDVDLGFSPSTNTLPIRRLALSIGVSSTIDAAWVLFPDFELRPARQTYTRLSAQTYRYASGDFASELSVDADGLVVDYWEWRRIGAL